MRGHIQPKERVGPSKRESWSWQRKGCGFDRCEGMVLIDERSGPGRSEEWSWQIRGVVLVDERSGPGR